MGCQAMRLTLHGNKGNFVVIGSVEFCNVFHFMIIKNGLSALSPSLQWRNL